ncbi:flavin reductase family protein [Candidatus Micrarchaeota archaeon]|nr:flavin reductase family protein [Candidatus Micrarchaeota archaeon]
MKIEWGNKHTSKLITNVGLITSNGPHGHNIMAAEWTHHISYEPGLLAVHLFKNHATTENILETKEFGISIASVDQSMAASIAGGKTGKEVDKISVLKDLGVEFYSANKINTPMVKGAAMNAECKLIKSIELGDHLMFVGEVVELSATDKEPLAYHAGKYWKIGEIIEKPGQETLEKFEELVKKYKK